MLIETAAHCPGVPAQREIPLREAPLLGELRVTFLIRAEMGCLGMQDTFVVEDDKGVILDVLECAPVSKNCERMTKKVATPEIEYCRRSRVE